MQGEDGFVLIDFGLATIGETTATRRGTTGYLPPESVLTRESDIFCLGVTFFYYLQACLRTKTAFGEYLQYNLQIAAATHIVNHLTGSMNQTMGNLLLKMISIDPQQRPSLHYALFTLEQCKNDGTERER